MSPRAAPLVLLAALAIGACAPLSPGERYERWLADGRRESVDEYRRYLHAEGVADLVPMTQLLRSGRRWRRCGAAEFVLPPKPAWPDTMRSLRLIGQLRGAGLLDGAQIGSGYRDPKLNRCEGGSSLSKHMRGGAYDFDFAADVDAKSLCAYWRLHGPAVGFGLGFYDRRHLHIDTAGFRTWGGDYSKRTSLCTAPST